MWPLVLSLTLLGQVDELPLAATRTYAPRDAARLAWLDLSQNVPLRLQAYGFYVWLPQPSKERIAVVNFTMNAVLSQSAVIVKPRLIADGRLLYYNLLDLWPQPPHFHRGWDVLQTLADFEPYFRQPRSYTEKHEWKRVNVAPYLASDGSWYTYKWEKAQRYGKTEPGLHAGGAGPLRLLSDQAGGNQLPIVRDDWLIATAWGSIEIEGIKGSYYDLAGIEKSKNKNQTDFDLFLESVVANQKLVQLRRTDQRAVMLSKLTKEKKWRMVEAFFGAGVRPEDGPPLITITHDIQDDEHDAKRHAFLNLLAFEDQAREVIAAKRNGLHLFFLSNGKGERQDEAPFNVVPWRESPHGTARLTAGISCVACHGQEGGYQPVVNYVTNAARRGLVPTADLTNPEVADAWDRLQGLYKGELNGPMKQAAMGYATAIDRCTNGVFGAKSVEGCSAATFKAYQTYFETITPQRACRELGYEVSEKDATRALAKICPPVLDEDGRIGNLRVGLPVNLADWQEVYYEMALRDALRDKTGAFEPPTEAVPPAREPAGKERQRLGKPGVLVPKNGAFGGQMSIKPESPPRHTRPDGASYGPVDTVRGASASGSAGSGAVRARAESPGGSKEPAAASGTHRAAAGVDGGHIPARARADDSPRIETAPGFGLYVYGPAGSEVWLYQQYVEPIAASGAVMYRTDRSMHPGDKWADYRVTVKAPNGKTHWLKVDLQWGIKTTVTL